MRTEGAGRVDAPPAGRDRAGTFARGRRGAGDRRGGVDAKRGGIARVFKGKRARRLPAVARGCVARGEDQSTGDDFITTRHSSATLKYQKSGGLTQVWKSVTRRAWKFSAQCFPSYRELKRLPVRRNSREREEGGKGGGGRV